MNGAAPTYDELLDQNRRQARLIDELRAEVERLKGELEQARRAGKRQAAPFSKTLFQNPRRWLFVQIAERFCESEQTLAEEATMAKKRVSETLWKAIAPLLPEHKPSPKGGRPPVCDRACLEGIIFVLKTGMPWQMLPTRLGYGSGSTCWRRFHAWTRLGVWPELHRRLLRVLGRRGKLNLERAVIDSASVRA